MIMKGIIVTVTRAVGFNCEFTTLRFSTCHYEKINCIFYIPDRKKGLKVTKVEAREIQANRYSY